MEIVYMYLSVKYNEYFMQNEKKMKYVAKY